MLQARFVLITLRISAHNSVDCVGVPVHFSQLCIESSDSNDEQSCTRERMKRHKSPSLLPVVSAGCEPRSVDAGATEEHVETAEGGSPVVRVARRPGECDKHQADPVGEGSRV